MLKSFVSGRSFHTVRCHIDEELSPMSHKALYMVPSLLIFSVCKLYTTIPPSADLALCADDTAIVTRYSDIDLC